MRKAFVLCSCVLVLLTFTERKIKFKIVLKKNVAFYDIRDSKRSNIHVGEDVDIALPIENEAENREVGHNGYGSKE